MLERLAVPAEGAVFIDDQPRNLQGAQEVGIAAVHLDPVHPAAGFAQARRLLGLAGEQRLMRGPAGYPLFAYLSSSQSR
jgi:FMN phosphatase YigB (HAD superfamily)